MGYHAMAFDFPLKRCTARDSVLYVTGGELTVWVDGEGGRSLVSVAQRLLPQRAQSTKQRRVHRHHWFSWRLKRSLSGQ